MGIVDTGKRVRSSVLDRLLPQRVVFHHVPKCGGTSVGRALRKRFLLSQATVSPEATFQAFRAFTGRSDHEAMLVDVLDLREQMMLALLFDDVRCVSAHVRYSDVAYELFKDHYKFVTIMRDPVARFLSHYRWNHGKPEDHGHFAGDFDAFLASDRAQRYGAMYVEYYAGLPKEADIRSDAAVDAAVNNLSKFSVIGDLGNIPAFEQSLHKELGVRVRIGFENKAREQTLDAIPSISPEQKGQIQMLCAPDIAVWRRVMGESQ